MPSVKNTVSSGRKYFIRNWHDTLLLTIANNSTNDKATDQVFSTTQSQTKLDLQAVHGQIWSLNVKNDGRIQLFNTTARKYAAVVTGKDAAQQEVIGSIDPSEWYVNSVGGYAWTITSAATGLALGHLKPKPAAGDTTCLMPHIASQNQIWFFEELDDSAVSHPPTVPGPSPPQAPLPGPTPPQVPAPTPPAPTPPAPTPPAPTPPQVPAPTPPQVPAPAPPAPTPPQVPAPTPPKPSVAFNQIVQLGSFVIRNKSTNMTLTATYDFDSGGYTLTCDKPGYPTMFTISKKDTSEYNLFSSAMNQYVSANQDQILPSQTAYGWVFAPATPGYVYISPAQSSSSRKVIQCGAEYAAASLADIKSGDELQMWSLSS